MTAIEWRTLSNRERSTARTLWSAMPHRLMSRWAPMIFFLLCLSSSFAQNAAERDDRWAILVAGVSGTPEFQDAYLKEIKDLHSVLVNSLGFSRDQIIVLFDDPSKDPDLIQYKSTRANLQTVCFDLAGRVHKDDLVFVFIEGHGDYNDNMYKLNLVGPDPTAEELAAMFYAIPTQRFITIDVTNCSGGSIAELSQDGKIVITATKSGMEKNQTHMGQYIVDALRNNAADADKNGRLSILETFSYARQKVEQYYSDEGLMQTEHPVLEDTGDAEAQSMPSAENGEGLLARTTFLDAGVLPAARVHTPEEEELRAQAHELEKQIETLKYAKGQMAPADYEKKLEGLLLGLARINAKLPKEK